MKKFVSLLPAAMLIAVPGTASAMCAMCRKALEENGSNVIQGFYWSIILLCGIPLLIFICAGWVYMDLSKKAKEASVSTR